MPEPKSPVVAGLDLYVSVHTHFSRLQPLAITVSHALDPEAVERDWELKRELDMRIFAARLMAELETKERALPPDSAE